MVRNSMRVVFGFTVALAALPGLAADGKAVYEGNCIACHGSGIAGAPRFGDAAAWAPRIKTGTAALHQSALKGKGGMPAKGGNPKLSDADVKAAVDYMVGQAGGKPGKAEAAAAKPAEKAAEKPEAAAGGGEGKDVYDKTCVTCHGSGVAGAPKVGDAAAWGPRVKGGVAGLYQSALKGKNAMPAKGGNPGLSDAQVKAAVDYIVAQAGGGAKGTEKTAAAPAEKPAAAAAAPAEKMEAKPPAAAAATRPAAAEPAKPAAPAATAAIPSSEVNAFNRLLRPASRRNLPATESGIHDPTNDGTQLLQPPLQAFNILPRSTSGNYVNWVQALEQKKIAPRHDKVDPKAQPVVMDLNIVREVKGSMPDVVYPHKQHTEWLDCSNCHPAIFIPQKGANQISMAAIMLGEKCGVCHGKVAFPISECRLCHSKKKDVPIQTGAAQ
jgi:c(7)-type cytochrome triheme protein